MLVKTVMRGFVATFVACLLAFLCSGVASASLSEFTIAHAFSDGDVEGIAVDESTNDVYVYNAGAGVIDKFDSEGNPVNFSALGSNEITGVGHNGFGESELAVDNSSGPAKGDIYLASGFASVQIFGEDGKPLGKITQAAGAPWGEVSCGVAVDGSGNVYVGVYEVGQAAVVNEYTPTSGPVTNSDYVASLGGLSEICEIAASPGGSLYVTTWTPGWSGGPLERFDGIHGGGATQLLSNASGTVAVANSPGAEVFAGRNRTIEQFDSSGNLLGSIGLEAPKYTVVAVNAKNGKLYGYDENGGDVDGDKIQIWQGVIVPEIRTDQATNLDRGGTATVNGTVNPEGISIESCEFEYGLSTTYESSTPCSQATPLTGSSAVPVSAGLSSLLPNHVYHYRLSTATAQKTFNGSDSTFTILVLPLVEEQQPSAADVTRATARLSGVVDPEHGDTRYYFEYGTSEQYGDSTTPTDAGEGGTGVSVSQQLSDLRPNTTYHYRLVAQNVAGTTVSGDQTFTTGAPTPPSASTGPTVAVAQNTATITGSISTNGLPTSYGFEIATSTDYGPPTGLGYVGAGGVGASVSLGLSDLVPGTTYHYRVTATNVDGTVYGADGTFTTSVYASTFAEPPAPLPFVTVPDIAFPSEAKVVAKEKAVKKKTKSRKKTKKRKHHTTHKKKG